MLKAIHQHARFGQQMVDLNTNLTVIIYYRMYPTLFRRKEQTWKRLRVGLRTDDNIPKNAAISLKRSYGCCYCCNYLLSSVVQTKHCFAVYVWLAQLHMAILFPLLDAIKLASLWGR